MPQPYDRRKDQLKLRKKENEALCFVFFTVDSRRQVRGDWRSPARDGRGANGRPARLPVPRAPPTHRPAVDVGAGSHRRRPRRRPAAAVGAAAAGAADGRLGVARLGRAAALRRPGPAAGEIEVSPVSVFVSFLFLFCFFFF